MIIDTHVHLYDPSRPEGTPWPPKDNSILYKPTRTDRCKDLAAPAGVDGVVVVECSEWIEDNQWVLDLAKDDPFIVGLVGNLDPHDDAFESHLDRFAKDPIYRGIRARLWDPDDIEKLRLLSDHDLSLDLGCGERTLEIADAIPELRIIIHHSAGIKMDGDDPEPDAVDLVNRAAERSNVFCKLSGMMDLKCTIRPAPTDVGHYAPYLDILWNAFGEDRMIFGSDWPVSDKSERTYGEILTLAQDYIHPKGDAITQKVFCDNAKTAYKWIDRR